MNKRVWLIVETATKEVIDKAGSSDLANKVISQIEKADKEVGTYEPQRYEIVCKYADDYVNDKSLNDYQIDALKTAIYPESELITYPALGLNGEAGEVADKVKKVIRDNRGKYTDSIRKDIALEVGDCLWYIAVLADRLGFKLSEIAEMNITKLQNRVKKCTINGSGDYR